MVKSSYLSGPIYKTLNSYWEPLTVADKLLISEKVFFTINAEAWQSYYTNSRYLATYTSPKVRVFLRGVSDSFQELPIDIDGGRLLYPNVVPWKSVVEIDGNLYWESQVIKFIQDEILRPAGVEIHTRV